MAIIPALPYTLTNGTTADANQVMADLNNILTGVNTNGAANGPNSDITSLTGLTTPLSVSQGGTGANNAAGALVDLGAAPSASPTFTGTSTFNGPVSMAGVPNNIKGVTDGSNAPAGNVGEYITGSLTGGSVTTNVVTSLTVGAVTLQPGDWDVWGMVGVSAASVGLQGITASISTTLNAHGLAQVLNYGASGALLAAGTNVQTPMTRINISVATIVYVTLTFIFTGTASANGSFYARRVR